PAEILRAGKRLLAPAVLILELEPQRLAGVEAIERSVERRASAPQRGADRGLGRVDFDERLERWLGRPRARQPNASRSGLDLPARGRAGMSMNALIGFDLDHAPLHAHAPNGGTPRHGLEHGHESC